MNQQAITDDLTKLYNRRYLMEALEPMGIFAGSVLDLYSEDKRGENRGLIWQGPWTGITAGFTGLFLTLFIDSAQRSS